MAHRSMAKSRKMFGDGGTLNFDLMSFICEETLENWQSLAIHSKVEKDVAIKEKFQI